MRRTRKAAQGWEYGMVTTGGIMSAATIVVSYPIDDPANAVAHAREPFS